MYVRSGITARAVAEGWGNAAVLARSLSVAVAGRRPLVSGPSTVAAMVRLAGVPQVTGSLEQIGADTTAPAFLRIQVGPVTWEVCDGTAYASMLRAWRQVARPLSDNPRRTSSGLWTTQRGAPPHATIPTMDETWQLSVLAAGTENAHYVAGGAETSVAAAAAAAAALVAVAEQRGRQEYRLAVGTTQLVVTPGLTEDGHVDVHAARDAVLSVARDAGAGRADAEEIAVRVRFAADGVSGMWDPLLANGVAAALHAVLSEFDRHAYCADGHVWINPEDNGADRGRIEHNRALLVRCPGRRVLVVGHDPVAHEVRALLADGCAGGTCTGCPRSRYCWRRRNPSWATAPTTCSPARATARWTRSPPPPTPRS